MYPWQRDGNMKAFALKLLQRNNLHFCLRITNKKTSTWCERSDPSVAALILHLWLTRRHSVGTTPTDGSCVPESLKRALVKTLSISRVTAHSSFGNGGKQRRRFSVCLLLSPFVNSATVLSDQISDPWMFWSPNDVKKKTLHAPKLLRLIRVCFPPFAFQVRSDFHPFYWPLNQLDFHSSTPASHRNYLCV